MPTFKETQHFTLWRASDIKSPPPPQQKKITSTALALCPAFLEPEFSLSHN